MYQALGLLSKQKLKHFRYLKQRFYDELVNGFYVYAKKKEKGSYNLFLYDPIMTKFRLKKIFYFFGIATACGQDFLS